jgi:hypothetical protein
MEGEHWLWIVQTLTKRAQKITVTLVIIQTMVLNLMITALLTYSFHNHHQFELDQ